MCGPRAPPLACGAPCPSKRKSVPDWVPAGTFIVKTPSTVSTSTSHPNAASVIETCSSLRIKLPSRVNFLCGLTWITIYRSPGSPSRIASPRPLSRIAEPSSTPAGILTLISWRSRTTPLPLHWVHFLSATLPSPPQVRQVIACWIGPNSELTVWTSCPLPLQVGQVFWV